MTIEQLAIEHHLLAPTKAKVLEELPTLKELRIKRLENLESFAKAYAGKNETYLLSVIGDIRQAMGDADKLMLDELAPAIAKAYQAQQGEAVAEVAPDGSVFWLDHNHCMIGAKLYTHPPAAEAEGVEG